MEQLTKLKLRGRKEVKKIVVITKRKLLIERIFHIMKAHIGKANSIERSQLFCEVFELRVDDVSSLQEWIMWMMLKQAMNRMRRTTKCFVISEMVSVDNKPSQYQYWVAKTKEDYEAYHSHIEHNIQKMRQLEQRCKASIEQRWYNDEWRYK